MRTAVTGRSVGVSVCLRDELQNVWIGTTVFNNDSAEQPVPDWRFAATTEQAVLAALQSSALFSDVKVLPRCTDAKRASTQTLAVDVLLHIEPGVFPDQIGGTNQLQRGIGLFQRSVFGLDPFSGLHAVLAIQLTDLVSRKSVGGAAYDPIAPIFDDSILLTPAQLDATKGQFTALLQQVAGSCMTQLGF